MNHNKRDYARELFTTWQFDGNLPISDIEGILGNEPYMVIGDFAYTLGYDGSIYMTPLMTRNHPGLATTVNFPDWSHTVEIPATAEQTDFSVNVGFPLTKLEEAISYMTHIRDILRQFGVMVDTDRS